MMGDNRMNFYGWKFTGALVLCASLLISAWSGVIMVHGHIAQGENQSIEPQDSFLRAIWVVLLAILIILVGHFALALQNYHARVAQAIEDDDAKKEAEKALPAGPGQA